MNTFRISLLFFCLVIFFSCEKEIDLNINGDNNSLVVEGYIQENYPAYVFLSSTQAYFNPIDSNTLSDIVVDDAQIFIERDDGITHKLTYVSQDIIDSLGLDSISIPIPGFYIDLYYKDDAFNQIGYTYKLRIIRNTDTLTSVTTIPPAYPIDSLWVEPKDVTENNYECYIWVQANDPDTLGNNITAYFKRGSGWESLFTPCAISIRTDQVVNGENFPARFARSGRFSEDNGVFLPFYGDRIINGEYKKRDVVFFRISHINNITYKFWRSVDRAKNSTGNPFAEPMNLSGNIKGGLGIWSGYGTSYYKVPIVADTVIYSTYNDLAVFDIF